MLFHYDTRIDKLVTRPGVTEAITAVEFKRGGEQPIEIQFGASAADGAALSVQSQPTWTVEELPGAFEIWFGLKEDTKYEGTLVCVEKTFAWDATNQWYTGSIVMNTTPLNTLLEHDADGGSNDIASVDLMAEVKYRRSGSLPWAASINQFTATVLHNVLDGSESTPAEASSPTDYILATGATQITGIQEVLGLNLTDPTELTISSGAVTATQGFHTIDTESDAATDDLDTITAADGSGDRLTIYPASDARTVVIKDGTGNITTGRGDITLDAADKYCELIYNGTNWLAQSNAPGAVLTGWQLIETQTASSSATIDFTDLTSVYLKYKVVFEDVLPATDAASFRLQVSDDNGSTYESGSVYAYASSAYNATGGDTSAKSASDTSIMIAGQTGTASGEDGITGKVETVRPANATKSKFRYSSEYMDESATLEGISGSGIHTVAIATDGLRFLFSSGDIASGGFHLFGLKDA